MDYAQLKIQVYEHLKHCQYSEAEALYQQCIETEPDEKTNYWYLGLVFFLHTYS